jgi:plasmid stability protein
LTIDDELLKRARIRALEQGTSVNAVVRQFLEAYAGSPEHQEARRRVIAAARRSRAGTPGGGRIWSREELYEERTRWPRS